MPKQKWEKASYLTASYWWDQESGHYSSASSRPGEAIEDSVFASLQLGTASVRYWSPHHVHTNAFLSFSYTPLPWQRKWCTYGHTTRPSLSPHLSIVSFVSFISFVSFVSFVSFINFHLSIFICLFFVCCCCLSHDAVGKVKRNVAPSRKHTTCTCAMFPLFGTLTYDCM